MEPNSVSEVNKHKWNFPNTENVEGFHLDVVSSVRNEEI